MVPYNGRLAFRVARTVLAFAGVVYYGSTEGWHLTWVIAVLAAYAVYALGALPEIRFDSSMRAAIGLGRGCGVFWRVVLGGAFLLGAGAGGRLSAGLRYHSA